MWPVNSYKSKYGKNNDRPIGHVTKDGLEISVSFADDQKMFFYINAVDLIDVHPCRSNE